MGTKQTASQQNRKYVFDVAALNEYQKCRQRHFSNVLKRGEEQGGGGSFFPLYTSTYCSTASRMYK